ncbi:hypothetical protein TU94_00525 [Streptomyces cyaneogriseus subsp. noncyanogenus]|uniref:Major facilitator superfamily (MFS) profile domain-containing protein n=1 Tax=Streptomyces cyaneogriseus subsp. noncyanogenus TaxID=477245 RepID=A0A0C5G8A5_9ACTN|nr:MFS transporter [Streptomyces cyaneogriseus]AJP00261.1 hypothetical protein TU94_00525 [Streptomyces cyaneogriseus subsp. noncyanogenus]
MTERPGTGKRPVSALVALAVAAFCCVSVETVPVGLLSVMSSDLGVPSSRIGLLVTGYGVTVAVVSLPLARVVARAPRRLLALSRLGPGRRTFSTRGGGRRPSSRWAPAPTSSPSVPPARTSSYRRGDEASGRLT